MALCDLKVVVAPQEEWAGLHTAGADGSQPPQHVPTYVPRFSGLLPKGQLRQMTSSGTVQSFCLRGDVAVKEGNSKHFCFPLVLFLV